MARRLKPQQILDSTRGGVLGATRRYKRNPRLVQAQILHPTSRGSAEYPQEVPTADLADFIRGKAGLQHGIDNDVVETGVLPRPGLICAFSNLRMLLSGSKTPRAVAGLCELRISADADMIDTDDIHERPDIPRLVQGRIGEMRPYANETSGMSDHCGLLFADESRPHHSVSRTSSRVRSDHRPTRNNHVE